MEMTSISCLNPVHLTLTKCTQLPFLNLRSAIKFTKKNTQNNLFYDQNGVHGTTYCARKISQTVGPTKIKTHFGEPLNYQMID